MGRAKESWLGVRQAASLWSRYVIAVGWPLNTACLISVLVIVLHDFVFAGSPELFSGGAKLWDLVYNLGLAIVASYVFFYVNVHLPKLRDRENLRPFMASKTNQVVRDAKTLISVLKKKSEHDFEGEYPPTKEDVSAMCALVKPNDDAPLIFGNVGRYATWLEYFAYYRTSSKEALSNLYTIIRFLDTEHLRLLRAVDDCSWFSILRNVEGARFNPEQNLSGFSSLLHDYFQGVKQLEEYVEENLK
jgi:hypothetical protein